MVASSWVIIGRIEPCFDRESRSYGSMLERCMEQKAEVLLVGALTWHAWIPLDKGDWNGLGAFLWVSGLLGIVMIEKRGKTMVLSQQHLSTSGKLGSRLMLCFYRVRMNIELTLVARIWYSGYDKFPNYFTHTYCPICTLSQRQRFVKSAPLLQGEW